MDENLEKKWREEIRKQLEAKEKFKRESDRKKEDEFYSRLEYAQKEKIRREEEADYYSSKGYIKIMNKYGETEWLPPEEARKKKRRSKKKIAKKKKSKNFRYLWETAVFLIAMLVLYSTYKYFKKSSRVVAKPASIVVTSNLPGAKIFLNGQYTNRLTPDTLSNLKPGKYWIVVDKAGYEEVPPFQILSLKSGQTKTSNFEMTSHIQNAKIHIAGIAPPFDYYVDGHYQGSSNKALLELPTGKHLLRIEKKGFDILPKSQWIIVNEEREKTILFKVKVVKQQAYLRITSNIHDAFIFMNYENTGKLPSNRYFAVEPGNYSFQLAHPEYKFIPAEKIIKISQNEYRTLIFSGEKESATGKIIITNCEKSQVSIDGHLTPFLCDDTISAVAGNHYLSALDQKIEQNNLSSWFGFSTDSTFLIHWDINYRKWEKVKEEI